MTLARLQQILTLGAAGLAGLLAGLAFGGDHPVWAFAVLVALVSGHAIVLAFEFALARVAHGTDPAPRAGAKQLASAWWAEALAAPRVFCWRQPFAYRRWPDLVDAQARAQRGQRGVVLVHGFFCNRGVWNRWLQRLHACAVPCVAVNLEPVFGSIDDYVPLVDEAVRRLQASTGLAPVVVAHSMGGLAVRRWWVEHEIDSLHRLITIATPHRGTALARFALSPNTRQMRRHSDWLRALEARETPRHAARCTCFYSHCDNIVMPPSTATLPGADNRHLQAAPHVQMVDCPEPWLALVAAIERPHA